MPPLGSQKLADSGEVSNLPSLPSISEIISVTRPNPLQPNEPSPRQPESITVPRALVPTPLPYRSEWHNQASHTFHPTFYQSPSQRDVLPASNIPTPPFNNQPFAPSASTRFPNLVPNPDIHPNSLDKINTRPSPWLPDPWSYQLGQPPTPSTIPRTEYGGVNECYDMWTFSESLIQIKCLSQSICNFADAFGAMAPTRGQETYSIRQGLPMEQEVNDMLKKIELIEGWFEHMKVVVQTSIHRRPVTDPMLNSPHRDRYDEAIDGQQSMPEYAMVGKCKKRRGRVAFPGRCHNCNSIETPEWRRGPDGAGTLCNACGLRYSKFTRRQLDGDSIRPPPQDISPQYRIS